jgi:hypothetical protein
MADRMRNPLQFPEQLQRFADAVHVQQCRLEASMHSDGCKGGSDPARCCLAAKGGLNKETVTAIKDLAGAYTALGKEIRQWDGHTKTSLDTMSPAKKAQVVVRFILDQPLSARRDIYAVLAKAESDRPDGFGLAVTDKFSTSPAHE